MEEMMAYFLLLSLTVATNIAVYIAMCVAACLAVVLFPRMATLLCCLSLTAVNSGLVENGHQLYWQKASAALCQVDSYFAHHATSSLIILLIFAGISTFLDLLGYSYFAQFMRDDDHRIGPASFLERDRLNESLNYYRSGRFPFRQLKCLLLILAGITVGAWFTIPRIICAGMMGFCAFLLTLSCQNWAGYVNLAMFTPVILIAAFWGVRADLGIYYRIKDDLFYKGIRWCEPS